jgi:hypothetical protein
LKESKGFGENGDITCENEKSIRNIPKVSLGLDIVAIGMFLEPVTTAAHHL